VSCENESAEFEKSGVRGQGFLTASTENGSILFRISCRKFGLGGIGTVRVQIPLSAAALYERRI
jgi:hypothetical protein